ncbi:MAG TPA: cysteine desulfurase family protein [Candidatus Saccharimonadales bacterium]|nr:cysteine desulfurase family protein [Candidatus Saccharimonadales bacterium]
MDSPLIYMDYAAATPVHERVLKAMQPFYTERFYNPSATYLPAREVSAELQAARATVARWLGAKPAEIIFTAGATESTNLAIHGVMQQFDGDEDQRGNIVISAIEHPAVLEPALRYDCRTVPVDAQGLLDLKALEAAIDEHTVLVSVMYANNEVGTIQPIKDIAGIVAKKRRERQQAREDELGTWNLEAGAPGQPYPLYLHTDAAQAGNYLDLHVSRLGVDMLTLNGGKLYGPKQSGVLYLAGHVRLRPLIVGGGQESHVRSGTENVAQAIGFAAALDIAQSLRQEEVSRLQVLQQDFMAGLEAALPGVVVNGSRKKRLPNNVHVTFPGQDNERLLLELEQRGILAAAGSACAASDEEPSHVLRAMGVGDADARASLRFTLGRQTRAKEIKQALTALTDILRA